MNTAATGKMNLRDAARAAFDDALRGADAGRAVRAAVRREDAILSIGETRFDCAAIEKICVVAVGKAAGPMTLALDEVLGARLFAGVVSAPPFGREKLSSRWKVFRGGHPTPNRASLAAARAAAALLQKVDGAKTLVVFLISGGGSAMFEMAADAGVSLAELKKANEILVGCGATIAEINALRRRLSKVKGGGLAALAPQSQKLTLIVSDTNAGEACNVASGLTLAPPADDAGGRWREIIARYDLQAKLPPKIYEVLKNSTAADRKSKTEDQNHIVLRDNADALAAARARLERLGFAVELAAELVEQEIGAGCARAAGRLIDSRRKTPPGKPVAVLSGGEFVCPVRGGGTGGRSSESALRTAIIFDELKKKHPQTEFAALFAGTDGLDGNSPAAGAICDGETLTKARSLHLNAREFLEKSDSYHFFALLGDQLETGPTGTNVRDVRILLAL